MKAKLSRVRRLIAERLQREGHATPFQILLALNEGSNDGSSTSGHSIDAQVDRLLSQYEKAASNGSQNESRLFEADDDGSDESMPEEKSSDAPAKASLDSIDVESFVNDVMNLIENHENLLEFKSTLARRALNFLTKTYDDDVVEAAKQSFRDDHSLVPGETTDEREAEDFKAPRAGEAGPL